MNIAEAPTRSPERQAITDAHALRIDSQIGLIAAEAEAEAAAEAATLTK
jgi:hypothetical protein